MARETDTETIYEKSARLAESMFRDIQESDLPQTLKQDLRETYDFYLDRETRERLASMSPMQRWAASTWHLVKNLFLKLTPIRRLILGVGLVLAVDGVVGGDTGNLLLGYLSLFFVLGLELKDKLLARDELQAGRAVQSALMPERSPEFAGWDMWLYTQPANEVGGDLVDYQAIGDGRFAVSLGDVSGKGLAAALFMAKLQATVRAIAPAIYSLSELGARVNEIFCRDGIPGRFASMVYAEVTDSGGLIRFLNAGHMPPLLIREGGIEEFEKGGPAVGLSTASRYKEYETELQPKDLLVIVSDGVSEARDSYGAFFGDDRLERLLAAAHGRTAREVGERIVAAVDDFVGSAKPSDDLSVVVVVRRPERILPESTT